MSYVTDQDKWIKEVGLRAGDKVLVVATAESGQGGWKNVWAGDESVGHVLAVNDQMFQNDRPEHGIQLDDGWGYPFFVLVKLGGKE